MAVKPEELALTPHEEGIVADWEAKIDRELRDNLAGAGEHRVNLRNMDRMPARVRDELVRRYCAAGWSVDVSSPIYGFKFWLNGKK